MKFDLLLKDLEKQFDSIIFNRYIKDLVLDEKKTNEENIYIIAKNPIIKNWVKTKYIKNIQQACEIQSNNIQNIYIITKNERKTAKKIAKSEDQNKNSILNPSYTFDSFIVGSSNQFAYNAAKSIAKTPGTAYNPVFIYGPTGLGKTHLIHAIGNYGQMNNKIVIYVTSEQFMNDFIYNLRNKTMDRFRTKYRDCDILLIDDIQFLSNKDQTQEEFFHTFNDLHTRHKQIVLTSDKPPKMIKGLEERLKSRFEWGLMTDISIPELETKIAIIKKKCEMDKISLNNEVINYIAANMGDNIREIESAIINLNAYASLMKQEIDIEFAKHVMKDQIKEKKDNISLENIVKTVSKELNIKPSDIKSKSRNHNIVKARRIVIYLARNLTPNSMPSLASYFKMKDHTSVSKNMKKINELLEDDENFSLSVENLKNKVLSE